MRGFDDSFRALADPTRRAILQALRDGPMNAGQLARSLRVAPNALSFHLRILRTAGLIHDRRQGQFIRYSLSAGVVDELIRFLTQHLGGGPRETERPLVAAGEARPAGDSRSGEDARDEREQAEEITLL